MALLEQLPQYFREARAFQRAGPCEGGISRWLRFFPAWKSSLKPGAAPLQDARPWITFPAMEFLRRKLTSSMRVFEYGSGGSTLFFCTRAADVVSVEHDREWAAKVQGVLAAQRFSNSRLQLVEPQPGTAGGSEDPADPAAYISSAELYRGKNFQRYVEQVDAWPNAHFDLILVDGRARPSCLAHAAPKVRPGGWLVLDNAERPHYQRAAAALDSQSWTKQDLSGPGPYVSFFWRTWAWRKQ